MAYARTNERPKMPPGKRDKSFRSSASSATTEILVTAAIWRRETPRSSRACFNRAPKSDMLHST